MKICSSVWQGGGRRSGGNGRETQAGRRDIREEGKRIARHARDHARVVQAECQAMGRMQRRQQEEEMERMGKQEREKEERKNREERNKNRRLGTGETPAR